MILKELERAGQIKTMGFSGAGAPVYSPDICHIIDFTVIQL